MKLYIKSITMIILIILFIFTYSGYTQINTGDALILFKIIIPLAPKNWGIISCCI